MASTWAFDSDAQPERKRPKILHNSELGELNPEEGSHEGSSNESSGLERPEGSWYLPSSDSALDSGYSDGATPPASCDDSQESFHLSSNPPPPTTSSSCQNEEENLTENEITTPNKKSDPCSTGGAEAGNGNDGENKEDDDDNLSVISGLSDLSDSDLKDASGPFGYVQREMMKGTNPRTLLKGMISADAVIPEHLDQLTLWKIIINMLSVPPRRTKLNHINTLDDMVGLIKNCKKILVLTGAGVSVSCGIPDFRSRDGVYARLAVDFPDLPDPQAMFDIHYFRKDPRPFFKFAREIYPGQFKPSPCHRFIRSLEKHNKLLKNYTQNIDTLEQVVGIQNIVQCHGSFATATCTKCKHKVNADAIKEDIFQQNIPLCPVCKLNSPIPIKFPWEMENQPVESTSSTPLESVPGSSSRSPPSTADMPGIMKPDIVFFGEDLGSEFHNSIAKDKDEADLLIMIGSSLKVRPVALIPSSVPQSIPQILINRERLSHLSPDIELLGDCDGIINQLCLKLGEGWEDPIHREGLTETTELLPKPEPIVDATSDNLTETLPSTSNQQNPEKSNESVSANNENNDDDDDDDEALWKPKNKSSLSNRLPNGQYYFINPSRYVFPGAEVNSSDSEDESDDEDEPSTNNTTMNASKDESSVINDSTADNEESSSSNGNASSTPTNNGVE